MTPRTHTILKFLMFNRFIRAYLFHTKTFDLLPIPNRYVAMMKEIWYAMGLFFPLFILFVGLSTYLNIQYQNDFEYLTYLTYLTYFLFYLMIIVLVNKDYFNSQSPVHRLLGLKVVSITTLESASKLKCMLRNITLVFWPIEIPFVLLSKERRLGDYIAGTKLILVESSEPEKIIEEVTKFKFDKESRTVLLLSTIVVSIWALINSFLSR